MLLGPQTLARCGREIFTEALLLATDFFDHYLRIFRAKDISAARNNRRKESFGTKLYRRLAHTRAIEYYTEILKPRLATNAERVFFKH